MNLSAKFKQIYISTGKGGGGDLYGINTVYPQECGIKSMVLRSVKANAVAVLVHFHTFEQCRTEPFPHTAIGKNLSFLSSTTISLASKGLK